MTLLLADDRTEVDDEEYFQTLGDHVGDCDVEVMVMIMMMAIVMSCT